MATEVISINDNPVFNKQFVKQHNSTVQNYNAKGILKTLFNCQRCDLAYLLATRPLSKALLTMIIERELNCHVRVEELSDCYYKTQRQVLKLGEISLGETANIYHSHFSIIIEMESQSEWQSFYANQNKIQQLRNILKSTVPTHLIYTIQFHIPSRGLSSIVLSQNSKQSLGLATVLSLKKDHNACYIFTLPN